MQHIAALCLSYPRLQFLSTLTLVHPAMIARLDKSLVAVVLERGQQQCTRRVAPG